MRQMVCHVWLDGKHLYLDFNGELTHVADRGLHVSHFRQMKRSLEGNSIHGNGNHIHVLGELFST